MTLKRPIPEALLERYLAGDLSQAQQQSIEAALAASATDRARLAELRADSSAFLIKHPVGSLIAKIPLRQRWRRFALWVPALVAAAAAMVWVVGTDAIRGEEPGWTAKGTLALTAYRKTATGSQALSEPAVTHAGDEIRFSLRAPADGFVAVLARDASGQVSVYYPTDRQTAAPYQPSAATLPAATRLDGVLGRERIWAVYGRQPFSLQLVVNAIDAGEALPPELEVTQLEWTKQ